MRLSEYSFLLEKESARLKKPRAGNTTLPPGMAAVSRGGTRVMRIPHDDRYLIMTQAIMKNQGEEWYIFNLSCDIPEWGGTSSENTDFSAYTSVKPGAD